MARFDQVSQACVRTFLTTEFPDGPPAMAPGPPRIGATGTLAPNALASLTLRRSLDAADLRAARFRSFADPAALLADEWWTLALVLSPFKQNIATLCDALAPAAAGTGVVDTLLRVHGITIGINTTSYAAAEAICQMVDDSGLHHALIAGIGATARSVAYGLRQVYPAIEIGFAARAADQVTGMVARMGSSTVVADPIAFGAELVINATTLGETDDSTGIGFDLASALVPCVRYFDLNNRISRLQMAALGAGCITASGVSMQLLMDELRVALFVPQRWG